MAQDAWRHLGASASGRSVARFLSARGCPVNHVTVHRWRAAGWRHTRKIHPLDAARTAVESAAPVLAGNPLFEDLADKDDRETLKDLPDHQILRAAARELAIASILVARAMQAEAASLVLRPAELAALLKGIALAFPAVADALSQATKMERAKPFGDNQLDAGDGPDPLADALEAWGREASR
jgi:hypothetical protein